MEENKITVVQALDERDLLIKKINGRIQKAQFVDLIRPKAAVTWEKRLTRAAFTSEAQSALQQIQDLIVRYDKINAAITMSNAVTFLETSKGRMSVSCAIALRNRLRGSGPYGEMTDFEGRLARQMEENYETERELARKKNEAARREAAVKKKSDTGANIVVLQSTETAARSKAVKSTGDAARSKAVRSAEDGAGSKAVKSAETAAGDPEKNPDKMRLVDPLDVRRRAEALAETREALLTELETKIKISNATTYVTIE